MARPRTPLIERLMSRTIEQPNGCIEWDGPTRGAMGYSSLGNEPGKLPLMIYGHIASYEHHKGPIPSGMVVRHTCDNPICVNPDHLVLGTTSDNRRDVTERKRGGEYGRKLSETDVREIRRLQEAGSTLSEITERFGISTAQASKICSRKAWKWLN